MTVMKMLGEEKATALLGASEKMFGLLNMTSVGSDYRPAAFPSAFVAREDTWSCGDFWTPEVRYA